MDITKVQTAITNAKNEIKTLVDGEIKVRSFNGLRALASADTMLDKAATRLDGAVKRVAPRAKKAKKDKDKK